MQIVLNSQKILCFQLCTQIGLEAGVVVIDISLFGMLLVQCSRLLVVMGVDRHLHHFGVCGPSPNHRIFQDWMQKDKAFDKSFL